MPATPTVDWLRHDLRHAVRSLRSTPIISVVAALSLALAVGANTAIFSIVNSLLLRALPVAEPERLVLVSDSDPSRLRPWTYPIWRQLQDRPHLFQNIAAWSFARFNLAPGGETDLVDGMWASASLFETLGVRALVGRTFSIVDDRRGGGPDGAVIVIGHAFWQRRFGGSADVVGRTLPLNAVPFTIIGVTPPSFLGPEVGRTFDVIVPLEQEPLIRGSESVLDGGGSNFLSVIARLGPGQSVDSATVELRRVQPAVREATLGDMPRTLSREAVDRYMASPFRVLPAATGHSNLRGRYQRPLLTVMAVVGLVLLIACVNIANLLLARATARRHELSVRLAIGASRLRLARQLLTESLVLSAAGAGLGLALAVWISLALVRQISYQGASASLDLSLDLRVLLFTVAIAVLTTMLFGTAPAFRASRAAPLEALNERGRGGHSARGGLAHWLVAAQMALSMVLLVAAGLFVRSFATLATRDLGFERDRVLVVLMDSQQSGVEPSQRVQLFLRARDAVRALPNVSAAAVSYQAPMGGGFTPAVAVSDAPRFSIEIFGNLISPEWFRTYGMRLVAGRDLTDADRTGPRVAVVNEAFARAVVGETTPPRTGRASPIGRSMTIDAGTPRAMPPMEIVGVVADAAWGSARDPGVPAWYAPIDYFDLPQRWGMLGSARLSVRPDTGPPSRLAPSIAAAVAGVHPRLALTPRTLADMVGATMAQDRLLAMLSGAFAALALLLSALGLYGVTAYAVARRRSEIGIRMAIGATPVSVVRLIVRRLSWMVLAGLAAGAALSLWAATLVGALIYGIQPRDPITIAGSAATLASVALLASWLPARRAARIDPLTALRES
jgi:predicted permease